MVKVLGSIAGGLLAPFTGGASLALTAGLGAASLAGKLIGGGKQAPIQPMPTVSRDSTAAQQAADDAMARRRGSAADILTGSAGVEAGTGTTGRLILGS